MILAGGGFRGWLLLSSTLTALIGRALYAGNEVLRDGYKSQNGLGLS